jgi:hypothetical protein
VAELIALGMVKVQGMSLSDRVKWAICSQVLRPMEAMDAVHRPNGSGWGAKNSAPCLRYGRSSCESRRVKFTPNRESIMIRCTICKQVQNCPKHRGRFMPSAPNTVGQSHSIAGGALFRILLSSGSSSAASAPTLPNVGVPSLPSIPRALLP